MLKDLPDSDRTIMASTRRVPFRSLLKAGRHALRTRQYSSARASDDCDIVIVGGGPAGLALASALGQSYDILRAGALKLKLPPRVFCRVEPSSHCSRRRWRLVESAWLVNGF